LLTGCLYHLRRHINPDDGVARGRETGTDWPACAASYVEDFGRSDLRLGKLGQKPLDGSSLLWQAGESGLVGWS
jgi:hypothetical protein